MNVVHIITALERGGAQRNTLETAVRLHTAARPQWVLAGPEGSLHREARTRLGRRYRVVPALQRAIAPGPDVRAAIALRRQLDRIAQTAGDASGPLCVHTHSSKAGLLGRLVARSRPNTHVIHTVHGFGTHAFSPRRQWVARAAERLTANLADDLVFVAENDKMTALEHGFAGTSVLHTIRSGIPAAGFDVQSADAARARAEIRGRLGLSDADFLVVTLANTKPQKDPAFHLEIARALTSDTPNAHAVFIGGAAEDAAALAATVMDAPRIHVRPFVPNPAAWLTAADVYLLASRWEGLPRTVLEALRAGLPCVVRDAGWAGELSRACATDEPGSERRLTALPMTAPAAAFARALRATAPASPRWPRATGTLPHAFTEAGMLDALDALYAAAAERLHARAT